MQAPDIYTMSKPHPDRYGAVEVTVGISTYGYARLHTGMILLRLAALAFAPFNIDIEVKA